MSFAKHFDSTTNHASKTLNQMYRLIALNMLSSAMIATICMIIGISQLTSLLMTIGAFVLLFVIGKHANKASGVLLTFLFTGLLGGSLGPTLQSVLSLNNGAEIVLQALGTTALIFFGLSAYALKNPQKDFSSLGNFLFIGLIICLIAGVFNIFVQTPVLSLVISSAIAFIMSGYILYDTNRVLREPNTNYVLATISMYLNIFNLFVSLLHIITSLSNDD